MTAQVANWERNNPWRQGQLLSAETVVAFGLHGDTSPDQVAAVVISHDCDLAQTPSVEPAVEVIVGRFVDKVDGNYTHCKNLRRLHVVVTDGDRSRIVELDASRRVHLPKVAANADEPRVLEHLPSAAIRMDAAQRNILQRWLAARYRRSAFPDEFDRRLRVETGVAERLASVFKSAGHEISGVFFDVDDGSEKTRHGPDDPYELRITLLYSTESDPETAEREAETAAARVREIFDTRCRPKKGDIRPWQWIELVDVNVVSDHALSYAQSVQLMKWQADHISLREDPPHVIFEA